MFDLDADIVPGTGAAGVRLGQPVTDVLSRVDPIRVTELHGSCRYEFGSVDLWVKAGAIFQIGLYQGYRGLIDRRIGIGSTLAELERELGRVSEDDDDNLVVAGVHGFCFETDHWKAGREPQENPDAVISQLYVFMPPN